MTWTRQRIEQEIARQSARTGASPDLLRAVASVESGFNPGAVGDGGSSFGLFQNHVGGAGGRTVQEARGYLNPRQAISNAARRFAGARTAEDAFRVQRPADHDSYVAKIQAALQGRGVKLNAPVSGGAPALASGQRAGLVAQPTGVSAGLKAVFADDPEFLGMLEQRHQREGARLPAPGEPGPLPAPSAKGGPGGNYRSLLSWARNNFGMDVQGSFQTTGGKHSAHSLHYAGKAVDFGDATTSRDQFNRLAAYAQHNPGQFRELFFNPLGWGIKNGKIVKGLTVSGHDDHMHVAV